MLCIVSFGVVCSVGSREDKGCIFMYWRYTGSVKWVIVFYVNYWARTNDVESWRIVKKWRIITIDMTEIYSSRWIYKWQTIYNIGFIDLWISSTCFGQSFAHLQGRKTVVYSNVVYCPNVVGWRSRVRLYNVCVRCGGCCSSNIPHTEHTVYASAPRTANLPRTTLGQCTTLL
jgi:hypothetical protein